ncbi:unnamed protein product [Pedinophyceae sp. YPF-701]|nr:unnamed protein product [Pedinophyceae sp. YPF-701]
MASALPARALGAAGSPRRECPAAAARRRPGAPGHSSQHGLVRAEAILGPRTTAASPASDLRLGPSTETNENDPVGPFCVLVSTASGPRIGHALVKRFKKIVHRSGRVVDLPRQDPGPVLREMRDVPNLRILVVGGDGTVGWVLDECEKIAHEGDGWGRAAAPGFHVPPVAMLPLGTGNDLARALGWGGSTLSFMEGSLTKVVKDARRARVVSFDRWDMSAHPAPQDATPPMYFTNYLGLGIDAHCALGFSWLRSHSPIKSIFKSRAINRLAYGLVGAADHFSLARSCGDLPSVVTLEVDGRVVDIPEEAEGIIVLNIDSHAGGVDMWDLGEETPGSGPFTEPAFDDRRFEIVAVFGAAQLGLLSFSLSRTARVAQGRHLRVRFDRPFPVQADGEAWEQPAGVIEVTSAPYQVPLLTRPEPLLGDFESSPHILS